MLASYLDDLVTEAGAQEIRNAQIMAKEDREAILLDLGTGPKEYFHRTLRYLEQTIKPKHTIACDISPVFIKEALDDGFNGVVADFTKGLPFAKNSIDVVFANQVIEHMYDADRFCQEIYRVLKPGGYALIGTESTSAWYNIFPLFFGYAPFTTTNYSYYGAVGNPWGLHTKATKDYPIEELRYLSHCKVFAYQGLVDILKLHGFTVERVMGAGYYPFPKFLAKALEKWDVRHAARLMVRVRKGRDGKKREK